MGCGAAKPKEVEGDAIKGGVKKVDDRVNKHEEAEEERRKKDELQKFRGHEAAKENARLFEELLSFLKEVPLFKRLPEEDLPRLAEACQPVTFQKGQSVIRQGEPGQEFFLIRSGQAQVSAVPAGAPPGTPAANLATLMAGDYFGEAALLHERPRAATVEATTELHALKVTRDKFRELALHEKMAFPHRKAVVGGGKDGAGAVKRVPSKPPVPKTPEERKLIAEALQANSNLQTMVELTEEKVKAITELMWKDNVPKGKDIIKEGDLDADYFYVVADGKFEVTVANKKKGEKPKVLGTKEKGGSFGELALLYLAPRAATVKAKVPSVVFVIDRPTFKKALLTSADPATIDEYVSHLNRVESLQPLLVEEKKALAQELVKQKFKKDEFIVKQGDQGNSMYILYEGEVKFIKDGKEQQSKVRASRKGQLRIIGERALLSGEVRAASVQVVSAAAKVLALDRDAFNALLGSLEDILKRDAKALQDAVAGIKRESAAGANKKMKPPATPAKAAAKKMSGKPTSKATSNKGSTERTSSVPARIKYADLSRVGLLGCGGFGAVELVEHKVTKETYALKSLSKGYIVACKMQSNVKHERDILFLLDSPFVIKLHETYNSDQSLFFLLEPALGGELYATYHRRNFHGSELHTRYYVAGAVCGFEHMHERRVVYRDLKPENLLLSEKGHLKITDMGLAKVVIGRTFTTCGTPDYFAPEVLAQKGHGSPVDWWTVGILIYELMAGNTPFEAEDVMETYKLIKQGMAAKEFPPTMPANAKDMILALCQPEPQDRLAVKTGGIKNLKEHPWYQGFDWVAYQTLTMLPPYRPVVKSKNDIANFSASEEDLPERVHYVDDGTGWDADFATVQEVIVTVKDTE